MSRREELLFRVAERYLDYCDLVVTSPIVSEMAELLNEIYMDEMWMLTQD